MHPIFVEPLIPASISVTSASANFPADLLLTREPSEVCQAAPGAGDVHIDVSFDAATAIDTAALLFHTETQGSVAIIGAETAAALDSAPVLETTGVHAGTVDPGFGTRSAFLHKAGLGTFKHWRLKISGRANQPFEAGRLILGAAFRPEKSLGYGLSFEAVDGGEKRGGFKGASYVEEGPVRPAFTLTFEAMTADDLNSKFQPMLNRCGQTRPVFMCGDPDNSANCELWSVYGDFARARPAQKSAFRWKMKLKINGI